MPLSLLKKYILNLATLFNFCFYLGSRVLALLLQLEEIHFLLDDLEQFVVQLQL
jgi:hypothetical protein